MIAIKGQVIAVKPSSLKKKRNIFSQLTFSSRLKPNLFLMRARGDELSNSCSSPEDVEPENKCI